jgi:hypothetical protein
MKGVSMSRIFSICLAALFAFSIAHAQGIDGKWSGEMQSPNGPMELTFNFTVSGDSLTGTVATPMGGEIPISNGKVDGKTFSFDVNVNEMTISHQCTFMADSISMKVEGMQGPMEIMLKRVPESGNDSK